MLEKFKPTSDHCAKSQMPTVKDVDNRVARVPTKKNPENGEEKEKILNLFEEENSKDFMLFVDKAKTSSVPIDFAQCLHEKEEQMDRLLHIENADDKVNKLSNDDFRDPYYFYLAQDAFSHPFDESGREPLFPERGDAECAIKYALVASLIKGYDASSKNGAIEEDTLIAQAYESLIKTKRAFVSNTQLITPGNEKELPNGCVMRKLDDMKWNTKEERYDHLKNVEKKVEDYFSYNQVNGIGNKTFQTT